MKRPYWKSRRLVWAYHRLVPWPLWSYLYNRGFCPITQEMDEKLVQIVREGNEAHRPTA